MDVAHGHPRDKEFLFELLDEGGIAAEVAAPTGEIGEAAEDDAVDFADFDTGGRAIGGKDGGDIFEIAVGGSELREFVAEVEALGTEGAVEEA